jgi:hypothetical protein
MPTFTDATGRAWSVIITVATLKRVRALANVDLLDVGGGALLERLAADPVLLADVLYAVVKPEADARQVNDEAFGQALAGDAIDHAATALLEALVAFFPQPRRRLLAQVLEKLAGWRAQALVAAEQRLADPELDAVVQRALHASAPAPTSSGSSSTAAPASSGSSPDR